MFAFVILHYKSIDETIECLENLTSTFKDNNFHMIVVDNNSLNDFEKKKIEKYTKDVILLDENVGFAKANNIGCRYAIKKYSPDFLCVINNDVFITQKEFMNIIVEDYKKYKFDMIGPKILSRTGESFNPFPVIYGKEVIDKEINYCNKLIRIYKSKVLYFLLRIYLKIKYTFIKRVLPVNGNDLVKGCALHGCSIIFSKKYYKKYDDIFYKDTFLFHEEEFLYDRIVKDKLISVYDPKLEVYHKEGSSVIKSNNNMRLSKLFKEEKRVESLKKLRKVI